MPKKVYITGCLGFIGSHITRKFLQLGFEVKGIDKATYAANEDLKEEFKTYSNFDFCRYDIRHLGFLEDCDILINTAAETHVDNSITYSEGFLDANVIGVFNLLEILRKEDRKIQFIQFSTDEVYGDIINGSHTESDALIPSNPYSATKAAADMLILAWKRTHNVDFTIVRPTNNYGCYQYPEKLIPAICKAVCKGEKFKLHNNGTPRRTWLHVEDTADAIVHIVNKDIRNEILNICGNYEDSNLNVAKKVVKFLTGKDNIEKYCDFGYTRAGQDVRYSVDASKLKGFGWNNKRNFDEELPKIAEHYKERFKT